MPKNFLFVGAIDGKVELEFLKSMGAATANVYVTSYLAGPDLLSLVQSYEGHHTITAIENVDGTNLKNDERFRDLKFDAVAWLGPTNDNDKSATSDLVQSFTRSAAAVLKPGGTVYVLQDLRTPNFRDIIKIPGAYFLCQVSLEGRTVTQSATSTKKKVMDGRKDHLMGFKFVGEDPQPFNTQGNADFESMLTKIMSSRRNELKSKDKTDGLGRYSKKEIANMIFDYASGN